MNGGEERLIAGRYLVISRLGSGGMGVVWLAYDERLHRRVAIKELLMPATLSGPEVERAGHKVMREGRIAAKLQHPHLIIVYDVIESAGRAYLVMEYVPSTSLAQALGQRGTLPVDEVARLGAQAAAGLAAAHEGGVVHRDVKPGNVLLGADGTVKITDFGVSRAVEDFTATTSGMIAGTPAFLSPEVAQGRPATFASDVYSLGATLYTAIEGVPPSGTGDNAMALLHRVASGQQIPPTKAGPLTGLLERMLSVDPAVRPTMAEVAEHLSVLAAAPVDARPAPVLPPPAPIDSQPGPVDVQPGPAAAAPNPAEARPAPAGKRPDPVDAQPDPADVRPGPVDTEPDPVDAQPDPADVRPGPVDTEPDPVDAQPGPVDMQPGPVEARPAAAETRPDSVDAQPDPGDVRPGPGDTRPEPVDTRPDPDDAQPERVDTRPEPGDAQPGPVDAQPGPAAVAPDPAEARPAAAGERPDPADTRPVPVDAQPGSVDARPDPAEARPAAAGGRPGPVDAPPGPADVRSSPADRPSGPDEALSEPVEARPEPTEAAPDSAETERIPGAPTARRRRRGVLIAAAAVLVALAGTVLLVALDRDDPGPDSAAPPPASAASAPSSSSTVPPTTATTQPTPPPTTTAAPAPVTPPPNPPAPPAQPQSPPEVITGYYALMPGNLEQAWAWLTPRYQAHPAGGWPGYQTFWGRIRSVRASDVTPRSDDTVEATVEYAFADGRVVRERHSYSLIRQDGRWKIDRSSVLSSVTTRKAVP